MKKKKKIPLKCQICSKPPTHTVIMDIRDKPGPPLKDNNVIAVACDEHAKNTSFDYWVPLWAFIGMCNELKKEHGIILEKRYCTLRILPFKK